MSADLARQPRPWSEMEVREGDLSEDLDKVKLATRVIETVQDIERRQPGIWEGNRRHARIYSGYLPSALAWGVSPQSNQRMPFAATKGLVRSVCDTATALIVRSRPKASIVTDGANWEITQQAEDLDQFMVGAYEVSGIYQVYPRCFHDCTVFGTGCWKYVTDGEGEDFRIKVERVLIDDLVVDEEECREHLEPENVYQRILVRTEALVARYAADDENLARRIRAQEGKGGGWPTRHVPEGRVVAVEAYNLPKRRRVLVVGEVVLENEEWPFDFFPYTFLWWTQPLSGFYGDGIAYRQYGRQERITYMYRWIQRCHDLFATPRAWVDPAGGPPTLQMSNELGAIITARRPPTFQQQNMVVPPEVYRWLDELERGGYDDEGISQVTANNQLPPGLESAPAQREYSFKEGQRFAPVSQRTEHAVAVEACEKMTALYRHHATKGAKPKMQWADMRLMHTIEWPDLRRDAYRVRAEPSSLESLSPASRAQAALELAQTGWISPAEGRSLVGHPDLKEASDLDNAPRDYAKMVLRELYKGKAVMVDEYADLVVLDEVVRKGRLRAIQKKAPKRVIDNLSRFLDALATQMAPPPAPPAAVPLTGPAAPAMAPSAAPGGFPVPMR